MPKKMRELVPRPLYEALRFDPPPLSRNLGDSVGHHLAGDGPTEYRPGLLDDLLYGVGLTLDRAQYSGPDGFERFKGMLREHLGA